MKNRLRISFLLLLLILIVAALNLPPAVYLVQKYDVLRLKLFIHQISKADRVVGTWQYDSAPQALTGRTFTGNDALIIIRTVTSANPARPPAGMAWACVYDLKATFYKGDQALGNITLCGQLFRIRDHGAPFRDQTGLLRTTLRDSLKHPTDEPQRQ